MRIDEGNCELISLKGDILPYCQGLIKSLQENARWVPASFYRELPGDEDFKDCGLQPGDFVYWKRYQIKILYNLLGRDHIRYY